MYIKINEKRYDCGGFWDHHFFSVIVTGVSPKPDAITGTVEMYNDNGELVETHTAENFARAEIVGDMIILSNVPNHHPMAPERFPAYRMAVMQEIADRQTQQITDAIMKGLSL